MNTLIQEYIDAGKRANIAIQEERDAEEEAEKAATPENLRPVQPTDIVEGAVIWYPSWDEDGRTWNIVCEVLHPNDPCKAYEAYVAHEGCRYGLHDAFVEVEDA